MNDKIKCLFMCLVLDIRVNSGMNSWNLSSDQMEECDMQTTHNTSQKHSLEKKVMLHIH